VKNLPRIRTFSYLSRTNPVFDILRSNFDSLPSSEQNLFMDVGLFRQLYGEFFETSGMQWLCNAHKEDEDAIRHQINHLHLFFTIKFCIRCIPF